VVDDHEQLAPLYNQAAQAIAQQRPDEAAKATKRLATAQAERLSA
jgi:hypothetical protein